MPTIYNYLYIYPFRVASFSHFHCPAQLKASNWGTIPLSLMVKNN